MKKIAIFGDSWSYSSFVKLKNFQEMPGNITFQKLFSSDKYSVDNYSILGGTNLQTVDKVNNHHKNYDLLIVFQTDPIRQYFKNFANSTTLKIDETINLPSSSSFDEFCELSLRNFYLEFEKINTPILLIGGSAKLCLQHVPTKIKILDKSWTELVVPEFNDNYFYWCEPTLAVYEYARKKFNWKSSLADFVHYEEQIKQKNYIWQTNEAFSWCHASDSAYAVMFNKITETLQNDYS